MLGAHVALRKIYDVTALSVAALFPVVVMQLP
jgi:hypothetical protein